MAKISTFLKIKGVAVAAPAPEGFKVSYAALDSEQGTGRGEDGTAFRDFVAEKVQLDVSWPPLKTSEISPILKAVKGGGFFPVEYPDPEEGVVATKIFYVADRTAACYSLPHGASDILDGIWTGLSFQLIEQ